MFKRLAPIPLSFLGFVLLAGISGSDCDGDGEPGPYVEYAEFGVEWAFSLAGQGATCEEAGVVEIRTRWIVNGEVKEESWLTPCETGSLAFTYPADSNVDIEVIPLDADGNALGDTVLVEGIEADGFGSAVFDL